MGEKTRVLTRGSNAPLTIEKISLRDTWIGSWLFFLGMLFLRGGALLYVLVWMVVTGRWSAAVVIAGIAVSLFSVDKKNGLHFDSGKFFDNLALYLIAGALAVFMAAMALVNIWPGIGWALERDSHVYVWTYSTLADGTEKGMSMRLSQFVSWIRFMFIAGSAWVLWMPTKLLHWVFKIEQFLPKSRETTVAQIDPSSVEGPDGWPIGNAISRRIPVVEVEEDDDLPDWIGTVE